LNVRRIFGLVLMSDIDPLSVGMLSHSEVAEYVLCPYWANDGGAVRMAMPAEEDPEDNPHDSRKKRLRWAHG